MWGSKRSQASLETVSAASILLLHAHRAKTRESESVGFLREICYGSISVTGWQHCFQRQFSSYIFLRPK